MFMTVVTGCRVTIEINLVMSISFRNAKKK